MDFSVSSTKQTGAAVIKKVIHVIKELGHQLS
jgi:hypothetical protein